MIGCRIVRHGTLRPTKPDLLQALSLPANVLHLLGGIFLHVAALGSPGEEDGQDCLHVICKAATRDSDTFIFTKLNDSGTDASTRDVITDFQGGGQDLIDLSAIDANGGLAGDQAFSFIGRAFFSMPQENCARLSAAATPSYPATSTVMARRISVSC